MNISIFTIGFAQKSARAFFTRLEEAGVRKVIDIRLNNTSQLAGFTKMHDLEYFLDRISGIGYVHIPELAPDKDTLTSYKKKEIGWPEYEKLFWTSLTRRRIENMVTREEMNKGCLLCSEAKPDKCHRRLVAEYLREHWGDVIIQHL